MTPKLLFIGLLVVLSGFIIFKQNNKFTVEDPFKLFMLCIGFSIIFMGVCLIILGLDYHL
ncbi:hypothetical protein [Lentilactobacillus hilgardii]|uniref:hypothetical protein n=1 Tax=Lentilactobacillus hilgardii TaxID=1588 RepID=UPI00019C5604|nr:hypothetical protein [Lentilactobacillus hilgardii]EEI71367.1 hypothetical protein HMPREF0496_1394 [Lentilactobacillus hilgardii ATCC 27305]